MVLLLSGGLPAARAGTGAGWAQATDLDTARYGHTSVVTPDGKMWVIGGGDTTGSAFDDVWYSTNGINWNPATALPTPRYGHTSVVTADGTIWVMGGNDGLGDELSDTWSYDGATFTWSNANPLAEFPARHFHSSVVTADGKIWVIGGIDGSGNALNDVWSYEGTTWTNANPPTNFPARYGHSSVVFDGKIWVIGGTDDSVGTYNDVWNSTDGITWYQANASAGFLPRYGHSSVVFNDGSGDKIWVIGGTDGSQVFNDVWYSEDGIIWTQATASAPFLARYGHTSVPFDNRMWVIGGNDNAGGVFKDVWYSTTPPPTVTSITPSQYWNLSSINVNIAGTGLSNVAKVNLTRAGQENITAVNTVFSPTSINCDLPITGAVAGDWNVSVTGSDGQYDNVTKFTVMAPYPVVDLTQTSPAEGENTGPVTMTIIGNYFVDGATVKLFKFGQTPIFATNVNVISPTKITCDFDLTGAAVYSDWNLRVTNPDGQYNSDNNLFQFAILAVKSIIASSGGGGGGGSGYTSNAAYSAPAPVENQPAAESEAPPTVDTGKSADLHSNADAVTTQETTLNSNDNLAMVSIPQGIVAKDAAGSPLTSVSITAVAETAVPADTSGKPLRAYELGPNGATFSPAITLTFTAPQPQPGQEYTIRTLDHATNTWLDLPTTYHPEAGTVTAEVSHLCCFALFAKTTVAPVTTSLAGVPPMQAQPVPSPTQGTGTFILSGMFLWGVREVIQHPLFVPGIVIIAAGIVLYGWKRRRDRRKRLRDRLMKYP